MRTQLHLFVHRQHTGKQVHGTGPMIKIRYEIRKLVTEAEIDHIKRILDAKIETDEDYAELGNLVEDESSPVEELERIVG